MTEHILFIDSRNAQQGKSNIEFSILLNSPDSFPGEVYKNVISVELTGFSIRTDEDSAPLSMDPYIILDIEELNNRIRSNVQTANRAFCIIYVNPSQPNVQYIRGQDFDTKIRRYNPPLDSLSRLTVRILSGNGDSPTNPDFVGFFTMIFKIKTIL